MSERNRDSGRGHGRERDPLPGPGGPGGHVDAALLHAFCAGEVDEARIGAIRRHLEECERCSAIVEENRFVDGVIAASDLQTPSDAGDEVISDELSAKMDAIIERTLAGAPDASADRASSGVAQRGLRSRRRAFFLVAVSVAAALVIALVVHLQSGIALTFSVSADMLASEVSRGDGEASFEHEVRLSVTPDAPCRLLLLHLDPTGDLTWRFPCLDGERAEYFRQPGPFPAGTAVHIPPEGFDPFIFTTDREGWIGVFFVIPTEQNLSVERLREWSSRLESSFEGDRRAFDAHARAILDRLREDYPAAGIYEPAVKKSAPADR